jgi:hypothetical protein
VRIVGTAVAAPLQVRIVGTAVAAPLQVRIVGTAVAAPLRVKFVKKLIGRSIRRYDRCSRVIGMSRDDCLCALLRQEEFGAAAENLL